VRVTSLFHRAESSSFCNSYYLFTLLFLSKQTRHGRIIVSLYFFLFISGGAKCLSREQCVGWLTHVTVAALCNCSWHKLSGTVTSSFEWSWTISAKVRKRSKIPRVELNTFHLYQHYSCLCLMNSSTLDVGIIEDVCGLPNSPS